MKRKSAPGKAKFAQEVQQLRAETSATVETPPSPLLGQIEGAAPSAPVRAAQYVRMSTNRQEYSIEHQSAANHAYAARHGMEIVRTYADEGKSGLTFARRDALKHLIDDIQTDNAGFSAVLVYDVSRWGRFQDPDEASFYEHICKRAGIKVHYCAEQFENNGSPLAAMAKAVKRAMAAEYSRELSVKVFAGLARLAGLGFYTGGPTPYGTRRLLVDRLGTPKLVLKPGERKNLQADRVVLVPGPPDEIQIIQWIFSAFVREGKSETEIMRTLNARGGSAPSRRWTYDMVHKILQNEIYIGNSVWNRTSSKLSTKTVRNRPEQWFRRKWASAPIIEASLFDAAQVIIRKRHRRFSKADVVKALRRLHRTHGFLDMKLIAENEELPAYVTLHRLFGGLHNIRKLVGSKPRAGTPCRLSHGELLACLRRLLQKHGQLSRTIIKNSDGVPAVTTYEERFGSLRRAFQLIGYEEDPKSPRWRATTTRSMSDEQVLGALRRLLRERGRLSDDIIEKSYDTPSVCTYQRRFGSLKRAYEMIGYNAATPSARQAKRSA